MSSRGRPRRRITISPAVIMGTGTAVIVLGILATVPWSPRRVPDADSGPAQVAGRDRAQARPKSGNRRDVDRAGAQADRKSATKPGDSPRRSRGRGTGAVEPVTIQIQTPEPGFLVEVDGVLARDEGGAALTTPCELQLVPGVRSLRLAREKFRDFRQDVAIIDGEELRLTPEYDPFGLPEGYFASPFAMAAVGQRLELDAINAVGSHRDPWISADGLTLLFAGEQSADRGLFLSRRVDHLADFGPPELVIRTSESLCSPSLTADGLLASYGLRDKPQIRSLTRGDVAEPFEPGPVLAFTERRGETWPQSALAADGLRLYWQRLDATGSAIKMVSRAKRSEVLGDKPASETVPVNQVRFSADGSRVYWLQGQRLMKATRLSKGTGFGKPQELCAIPEASFAVDPNGRQFTLSDDEVWLFGSDGPHDGKVLFALRLQDAPSHGAVPRGRPIESKTVAPGTGEAAEGPMEPMSNPDSPLAAGPKLLPYTAYRVELQRRLLVLDFDGAQGWVEQGLRNSELAGDRELLEWDQAELVLLQAFWKRYLDRVSGLRDGDPIRLRGKSVAFTKREGDTLEGRNAQGTVVRAGLKDLSPAEIVALADRGVQKGDPVPQLEGAVFLAISGDGPPSAFTGRLQRAGEAGRQFLDRRQTRRLREMQQESARGEVGRALRLIDEIIAAGPKSAQATEAAAERERLPARLTWKGVGSQQWGRPTEFEHEATIARAPGSYLASAQKFRDFRLTLEWKTQGATAQGGIYFRYPGMGDLRKTAWKIMLANDAATGALDRFSTGALFGVKPPAANRAKPEGEWNSLEMTVEGDRVRLTLNGQPALDAPLSDPNIPGEGLICLDGEFGGITYRRVLIQTLER